LWTAGRDAPDSTHVRGMGSVCSTTELRPLVVSVCTQEPIFRTAVSVILQLGPDVSVGGQRQSQWSRNRRDRQGAQPLYGLQAS
jgi:hypothetical protein